jgi:hypothetical protein
LIESGGYQMTSQDERDLYEQVENVYQIDPDQRRLFTLMNILNRQLARQLQKWCQGGQYGALFDNVEDNLTFARFQAFDFEGMDKYPQVLEPLLFYILHRANASIYDPALATTFKAFVMDEAWRFFRNDTIKQYIVEAIKTWRKRNAAMILATQSSDDLHRSEILSVIIESCATKMFLANPGMDRQAYRDTFHLNETEADRITDLVPKQQILVKRPDRSKVLNLNVDPLRTFTQQTNQVDIGTWMDEKKIVIIATPASLDAGSIVGGFLIAQAKQAAFRRIGTTRAQHHFHLIVDEWHRFITSATTVEQIINESGKAGLSVILANQETGQIPSDLLKAVFSIPNIFVYGVNMPDARALAHLFNGHVSAETLASQGTGSVYGRIGQDIVNYQTPPPLTPNAASAAAIIAHSQTRYHATPVPHEPPRPQRRIIDTFEDL